MNQDLKKTLWAAADKLRSSMDAAEYKHIVLGLIFLKYISDAFDERRDELAAAFADPGSDLHLPDAEDRALATEERDYYTMANVFWVPGQARWETIRANAKQADIGTRIDLALDAIEADNPRLKGILDKRFGRAQLEAGKLGELVDLISTIGFGDGTHAKDVLGEVYEYFLGQFASAEGKKGGQFYTPASVVRVLVEVLAPHKGKVYDPCCGSGGMFVQSEKFIESHGGRFGDVSIYGQEANPTTWRLVAMNLAIRGMDFNLGKEPADTFHRDQHPDLKADFVLANPPFNVSDWGGDRLLGDKRWVYGTPPANNANYAWLQHILHHLGPRGSAAVILANGTLSSLQSNEAEIRAAMVEADIVDCIIALPSHLFFNMYSQVCVWILSKDKVTFRKRDCRGEILFIDARGLGDMVERTHRELTDEDVSNIAGAHKAWVEGDFDTSNVPGFCRVAKLEEVRQKRHNLIPARYVGTAEFENAGASSLQVLRETVSSLDEASRELQARTKLVCSAVGGLVGIAAESNAPKSSASMMPLDLLAQNVAQHLHRLKLILFRSWFIDFEPVFDASEWPVHVRELFGNEVVESELGPIPSGWRVGTYSEILRPKSARIGDEIAPEYSATVRGLELRELRFNKQLSRTSVKNKRIERNDLVFGLSRKTVNFGLMKAPVGSVSPVYEIFGIDSSKFIPELLELYIRGNMATHLDILKSGAREGAPIDRDYLLAKEVLIPDYKTQTAFMRLIDAAEFSN